MAFLNDDIRDTDGLTGVADANRLVLCNAQPTTFTEANVTFMVAFKATPTIGAPENLAGGGRKVVVSAITDGTVDSSDTVTWLALVDTVGSRIIAHRQLSASKALTTGTPFTLPAFDIGIPGVAV